MKHLGIDAKVEIGDADIRVCAYDGVKRIEYSLPIHAAQTEHHDPVLAHLMEAVDNILQNPALTLIEGGKSRKS